MQAERYCDTTELDSAPVARNGEGVLRFPQGFIWGAATSPTQVEGRVQNEWTDVLARDGGTCHTACDHYHRYPEDIQWMSRLGIRGYRMGIEWSRMQAGPGAPLDRQELERYCDLLDRLKAAGIEPMVVLHHFSNPRWISSKGGWANRATVGAFVDYVTKLAKALKGRVYLWNTFNEPDTYATHSYFLGEFPPMHRGRLWTVRKVIQHMAEAHEQVCIALRSQGGGQRPLEVGYSKNWTSFSALRRGAVWDHALAWLCHFVFNTYVLRRFSSERRNKLATYLGLNYYGRVRFHAGRALVPAGGTAPAHIARLGVECDDMFERYALGLDLAATQLYQQYRLPIYVTEHGAASKDEEFRIRDLKANLAALHRALNRGVDVRGFYYWSLLDNFEWRFGYSKKFGLLEVDFDDPKLPRRMKPTAQAYRQICAENAVVI
jgi:beta-glucosidase